MQAESEPADPDEHGQVPGADAAAKGVKSRSPLQSSQANARSPLGARTASAANTPRSLLLSPLDEASPPASEAAEGSVAGVKVEAPSALSINTPPLSQPFKKPSGSGPRPTLGSIPDPKTGSSSRSTSPASANPPNDRDLWSIPEARPLSNEASGPSHRAPRAASDSPFSHGLPQTIFQRGLAGSKELPNAIKAKTQLLEKIWDDIEIHHLRFLTDRDYALRKEAAIHDPALELDLKVTTQDCIAELRRLFDLAITEQTRLATLQTIMREVTRTRRITLFPEQYYGDETR